MALTRECQECLVQWNFDQAAGKLDPDLATEGEYDLISSLAHMFGDVGRGISGGDFGAVIQAAVSTLLTFPEFTDHHEPPVPGAHP